MCNLILSFNIVIFRYSIIFAGSVYINDTQIWPSSAVPAHYNDVIMRAMASIVCLTVCSGVDQRKHQSSAWLAFVRGIHRRPVDSPHNRPVTRKCFHWWRYHTMFRPLTVLSHQHECRILTCFVPNLSGYQWFRMILVDICWQFDVIKMADNISLYILTLNPLEDLGVILEIQFLILFLQIGIFRFSCDSDLIWMMRRHLSGEKSILVQLMSWNLMSLPK